MWPMAVHVAHARDGGWWARTPLIPRIELGCGIVPRERVMIVVPALAQREHGDDRARARADARPVAAATAAAVVAAVAAASTGAGVEAALLGRGGPLPTY